MLLQNFELCETLCRYCGMGDWHVVNPTLASKIEDVKFLLDAVAPDQIPTYAKIENKKPPSNVKEE